MKLLVLGGTGFLGPHLVTTATTRGHEVTIFNRGRTDPSPPADVEHLVGDRDGSLRPLAGRTWDAVADTSCFAPPQGRAAAELLAGRVGHYTLLSTVSAYADLSRPGIHEDAELLSSDGGEDSTYGARKAAAEHAVEAAFRGPLLRVRPGVLVGPHDTTGRFGFWIRRAARGGDVLVPGPPERPVQVLDARDLAEWLVRMIEARKAGVYNAVGPSEPLTIGELLALCRAVTGGDASFTWVEPAFLLAHGVEPWIDVPLWAAGPFAGFHEIDASAARSEGLVTRPLAATIGDVLAWQRAEPERGRRRGLTPAREQELIRAWRDRPGLPIP
jgi:nucleoside-diphosphate-sugar epimerase